MIAKFINKLIVNFLIIIIKLNQFFISPILTSNCRFMPTCSQYCIESLKKHGLIILCQNDKQIIEVINEVAPEHLELNINNYKKYLSHIVNAGSICIGKYTPMAVTDYNSGSQHTLPTLGSSMKTISPKDS